MFYFKSFAINLYYRMITNLSYLGGINCRLSDPSYSLNTLANILIYDVKIKACRLHQAQCNKGLRYDLRWGSRYETIIACIRMDKNHTHKRLVKQYKIYYQLFLIWMNWCAFCLQSVQSVAFMLLEHNIESLAFILFTA